MKVRKTYTEMGSTMVVGIIVMLSSLTIIPSSAQAAAPCWTKIAPCMEDAKSQNYARPLVLLCCPSIQTAITNDRSCFCLGIAEIVTQEAYSIFEDILQTCSVSGTLDTLCPDTSPLTPSATPTTPGTTPPTSTATPLIASGTPSTPTTPPPTASGTPSTPTSTSSNGTINKMTIMLIPSLFVLFISFMIC
ncbi:hypothetical protein RND81_14G069000 [Saponaria officinalis]|uniref:Bifunctional inhibitor/plant lipid transfer protein/seed storage helical domain-containing protein n=1 Tax=Saponaria officinalis TaxID=3572 RepID=A0AAW1GLP4_SAPOF